MPAPLGAAVIAIGDPLVAIAAAAVALVQVAAGAFTDFCVTRGHARAADAATLHRVPGAAAPVVPLRHLCSGQGFRNTATLPGIHRTRPHRTGGIRLAQIAGFGDITRNQLAFPADRIHPGTGCCRWRQLVVRPAAAAIL